MKKLGLYLQLLMSLVVVILLIMFLNNRELLTYVEYALGVDLLLIAYNNYNVYKRKGFTLYYIAFALFMFVLATLRLLGV